MPDETDAPTASKPEPQPGQRRPWALVFSMVVLLASTIGVGLALSRGWGDFAGVDPADLELRAGPLAMSIICVVAALLLNGILWGALFRSLGARVGYGESVAAWLGSNLGRYLPGKIWQLTSLAAYMRSREESGAVALAVSVGLQAVMLVTGTAVGVALLGPRAFSGTSTWGLWLAAAIILTALHPRVLDRIVSLGARLLGETDATRPQFQASDLVRAGLMGLVIWGLYAVGFWLLVEGLLGQNPMDPWTVAGVFPVAYVIGYVVLIAPGGMIVREGAIAGLLSAVGGVALGPATAVALAARLWTTLGEVVAFVGAAGFGMRRARQDR